MERVEKIEQSVLAKAFRGELAPQDPNDEPAEELLKRILAEKAIPSIAPKGRRTRCRH
jgi:type I restriction enzyme S subunit